MKRKHLKLKNRTNNRHNGKSFLKKFLIQVNETAYEAAVKAGLRRGFVHFLSDFKTALAHVIYKDKHLAVGKRQ